MVSSVESRLTLYVDSMISCSVDKKLTSSVVISDIFGYNCIVRL